MSNSVFRKESLDRISSTDDIQSYMKINSPRLWMLLIAIMALLAGFIIYASFITLDNSVPVKAQVYLYEDNGFAFNDIEVEIPDSVSETVKVGMTVRLGELEGSITALYENQSNGKIAMVTMDDSSVILKEAAYDAEIVLETFSPMSFLFN